MKTLDPTVAPPMPNDWHPAYDEQWHWLRDWLNGDSRYSQTEMRLPMMERLTMTETDPTEEASLRYHTLTKHKCAGSAPYVGTPFVYIWYVGIDELGRAIAGDVRRLETPRWDVP